MPALIALAGAVGWMGAPLVRNYSDPTNGLGGLVITAASVGVLLLLLVVAYLTRAILGRSPLPA